MSTPLHAVWRISPSPVLTELFVRNGLRVQILDCEHGAYDQATLLPDILACERHGGIPLVRISGRDRVEAQRCLDLGAQGIVVPQLETADDFIRTAGWLDHAPAGTRGYNPFVRAYGYSADAASPRLRRPWFVPIVETLAAVEAIETIAAIERIDVLYVGVYDLSTQLECPGDMQHPKLLAAVDRILAACVRAGKAAGLMTLDSSSAQRLAARGVQLLVHGVDTQRIHQALATAQPALDALTLPRGATPLRLPHE